MNRIRPSTRIRFESRHLKGLVNRACASQRKLSLWRQRIQKYTDTSIHTYPHTQRIWKLPLWRAYTEISGYTERIRRTCVDTRFIRIKKFAHTKICRGPIGDFCQNFSWQIFFFTRHGDQNGRSLENCWPLGDQIHIHAWAYNILYVRWPPLFKGGSLSTVDLMHKWQPLDYSLSWYYYHSN